MAISTAMCTSFKVELLRGIHDFRTTGDSFKLALYTSSATLDASTTVYSATNEVSGTNYTATGQVLGNVNPTSSGTTAYTDFDDEVFTNVTLTARGCLIYNDTDSDAAVSTHDFGADKTATAGDFTIQFPAAASSTAILRIA